MKNQNWFILHWNDSNSNEAMAVIIIITVNTRYLLFTWCFSKHFTILTTSLKNLMHSVQFSHSVVSNTLGPHELQHTRPPCPLPSPGVYPNPCPLSRWCHPAISSSIVPFSSCPQPFPASGSFSMSQLFTWGGQSTGVSASALVLPYAFSSVQFSQSVVSDSLWPHKSQHTRPPRPSPTPGVYPNPCPSSGWCHPTISPSVTPFSSCPQSLPASGSFPLKIPL